MFDWINQEKIEAKARPLARALKSQYGPEAVSVCRAALTRPELTGERRKVIRMTLHLLDGTMAQAAENRRSADMRMLVSRFDLA
ncbi:MAG: hypothetical protein M3N05_01285 [Pseudomonadota bacterium]|nr:hypothetical protein [Pseudomonadota bacterium]